MARTSRSEKPPRPSASAPTRCAAGTGRAGCIRTATNATGAGSRASEIERLREQPARHRTQHTLSARNRFPGVVRSVEVDGVMALVEIEAGPHRITAAVTRDSVEELGLRPGVRATAAVKATSVLLDRG